jgi:hypothetical protein
MRQVTHQLFDNSIDRLVDIRAQIAVLQVYESELEELIKDSGEGRYGGSKADVLIYKQRRSYIDWKSLAHYLNIPAKIIKRFMSEPQDIICLKIVTKNAKKLS